MEKPVKIGSSGFVKSFFGMPRLSRPRSESEVDPYLDERISMMNPLARRVIREFALRVQSLNQLTWSGTQNIPSEGKVIVAGNHPTKNSPMFFGVPGLDRRPDMIAIAKRELEEKNLLARWIFRHISISVDRENSKDPLNMSGPRSLLKREHAITIMPEGGTDLYNARFGELVEGTRYLAARSGALVVPANIDEQLHVTFYPPIPGAEFRTAWPQHFLDQVFPYPQYPDYHGKQSWIAIRNALKLQESEGAELSTDLLLELKARVELLCDQDERDLRLQEEAFEKLGWIDTSAMRIMLNTNIESMRSRIRSASEYNN